MTGRLPNRATSWPRLMASSALRCLSRCSHCVGSTVLALTLVLAGPILGITAVYRLLEFACGPSMIPLVHPLKADPFLASFVLVTGCAVTSALLLMLSCCTQHLARCLRTAEPPADVSTSPRTAARGQAPPRPAPRHPRKTTLRGRTRRGALGVIDTRGVVVADVTRRNGSSAS